MSVEESQELIYRNVGLSLAEWSRVEHGVNLLFVALNNRKLRPNYPLLASFEANRSFDAKRKTLHTFVRSDPDCSELFIERFRSLDRKLANLARKRSDLAHFVIRQHFNDRHPAGIALLHPFGTFSGSFFERDASPLTAEDVGRRADDFAALAARVFRFVTYVKNTRGLLEPYDCPVDNPDSLLAHPFVGRAPDVITLG